MRLLPILLICCHCLLVSATIIDADCNDQTVFNAVDEALKFFNNEKEEGNLLVLYRITEAKIKTEEDGQMNHFVEFETYEGSCNVKSGKSWQECASTYTNQAKCSAHVLFDKDLKLTNVKPQNCTSLQDIELPVKVTQQQCLGCVHPIDKENKELLCFLHSTIEQINTDAVHPFYFDLESVVNATRQLVFGWKYHIEFLIRQTNCSKMSFTSKNAKECKIDNKMKSFPCTAMAVVTPNGEVYYQFLECNNTETGGCFNCPVAVDTDHPELLALLAQVMDEYNSNSNHTELYKVSHVEKATKKGFQRELYEVNFNMKPTNCSKPDYSILGDECNYLQGSPTLHCGTKINVTHKTVSVHSAPYCGFAEQPYAMRYSYGGLSPLRFSRDTNHEEHERNRMLINLKPVEGFEQQKQRQHGHNNSKVHKHDKKEKKNKKDKFKHKHQDSSDEENENKVTPAPNVSPHTDVVQRCPGRVWQPKILNPSIPTDKTFSFDDLAFAVEDLIQTDKVTDKNEPDISDPDLFFTDDDLLS